MNRVTFTVLATLARLTSSLKCPRSGFLQSEWAPSLPLHGWIYLWTFTLPGGTAPLADLKSCWKKFMNQRARDCPTFRGVRVFEPSAKSRWHVHALSVDRLDVSILRAHVKKYGFGRINVRRIPASKAAYVCKYITKAHRWWGTEGSRMWAGVGCRSIPQREILFADTWIEYVLKVTPVAVGQFCPWQIRNERAIKIWLESTMPKTNK